jgi:hypothetical protein
MKRISTLVKYLIATGNRREAQMLLSIAQEPPEAMEGIEEDWNINREERMLAQTERSRDLYRIVGETDFGWLVGYANDRSLRGNARSDEISLKLKNAIVSLGDGTHEFMGRGTEGTAINIGNNKVLKLFTAGWRNLSEDKKTTLTRDLFFKEKEYAGDETMVFASGNLREDQSSRIEWKIMEKLIDHRQYSKEYRDLSGDRFEAGTYLFSIVADMVYYISRDLNEWIEAHAPNLKKIQEEFYSRAIGHTASASEVLRRLDAKDVEMGTEFILKRMKEKRAKKESEFEKLENFPTFQLADDWMEKLAKHVFLLTLTTRSNDLHGLNIGIRPSTGTFSFFDV